MKKLILLLFIPLVFACSSDDKKNNLDGFNLNGKVKSLKETRYSAVEKFGEPVKRNIELQMEYLFDNNGNSIETNQYSIEGELLKKTKFEFDNDGLITISNEYNELGDLERQYEHKYDDKGNRIVASEYSESRECYLLMQL